MIRRTQQVSRPRGRGDSVSGNTRSRGRQKSEPEGGFGEELRFMLRVERICWKL